MTIDLDALSAINASPLPYDLFRDAHMALRRAMFGVIDLAGRADYANEVDRHGVVASVDQLLDLVRRHERQEEIHVLPLLQQHAKAIAPMVSDNHGELTTTFCEFEQHAIGLAQLTGPDATVEGFALYRDLASITALYLAHMAFEEGAAMAALRESMTIGDLHAVDQALRGCRLDNAVDDPDSGVGG